MMVRGKEIQRKEVCEANFTLSKGKAGKGRPQKKPKGMGKAKARPNSGKGRTCYACGKPGHMANACDASPEVIKNYVYSHYLKRKGIGVEAHGTEVHTPEKLEPSVDTNQAFSTSASSNDMDVDEQEIISTLALEDRLQI
jgi:hypothetical protein